MQISTAYSSTSLSFASQTSEAAFSRPAGADKPLSTDRVEISQSAQQSLSLALNGSVAGKGGNELGFSLDLQYLQASFAAQSAQVQEDAEGLSLSYAGTAAEVSSTSLGFTLNQAQAGDSASVGAKGAPHLNDEVSRIGKEIKPLVKEFLSAAGVKGGWGELNRFLRTVA